MRPSRSYAYPVERLAEPREHYEVGVKPDALNAADAERCEAVVVLQAAELALNDDDDDDDDDDDGENENDD